MSVIDSIKSINTDGLLIDLEDGSELQPYKILCMDIRGILAMKNYMTKLRMINLEQRRINFKDKREMNHVG